MSALNGKVSQPARRMPVVLATLAAVAVTGAVGVGGFALSGIYDVGASTPHWSLTYKLLETVRLRSIASHAKGIRPPASFGGQDEVVMGTEHFASHCAVCHGAPGVEPDDLAEGLYPKPPDLKTAARRYTAGELFWIVRNGIKMSGMPSWRDHTDAEIWATVAFLEKLPDMTEADYGQFVMQSMKMGGRHNHGANDETGEAPRSDMPMPDSNREK